MSDHEVLGRLLPYVPLYWARQVVADPAHTLVGREERIYGAVLFVDISGFTPISEALSKKGREGVDELSRILEDYFTAMCELVLEHGGEVVKFAGDSLIVIFPADMDRGEAHLGAALHCALHMQQAMTQFADVVTTAGTFPLRMKIGIGEGRLYNTTVGDEAKGMQPVFAGLPLARCIEAENEAGAGEIVVDAALLPRTPGHLDVGEARGTFRLIVDATDVPTLPPTEPIRVSDLTREQAEVVFRRLASYLPAQLVERIRQGRTGVYGEYRRVTIMFVKFGGLNYDWDPDVGSVLQVYFQAMRDRITRHGGRLNEVDIVSDGGTLVAFFGAPIAHEDDTLRALSCAWEMQQAVADVRLEAGEAAERLRQCIGVSSGPVFVGDVGAPARRAYTTVGDEVNLASRLMNLADWGEVVVTGWVAGRAVGRFEFEETGETRVKGKADRVSIYALVGPRQEGARSVLLPKVTNRRPLIGRQNELEMLSLVSDRAWQGQPQLVRITGEAGLGKSSLVSEVMQQWMERGGRAHIGDCRGRGSASPYVPWRSLLRIVFGLQEADSPGRQREKIDALLTFVSPSLARRVDLFADLLAEGVSLHPSLAALSPEELHEQVKRLLTDFLRMISQRQPLLLVFENMQDVDDASVSLFNDLLDQFQGFQLLIYAVYRPHKIPPLAEDVIPTTRLVLDELSEADSLEFAESLLADVGLSADLASQAVSQTQGNPLYLQEIVHALANTVSASGLGATEILSKGMNIPDDIADTIRAQIDHLDEECKLTLRIAAVIGRRFSFRVLLAAHPGDVSPRDLSMRLAALERTHMLTMEHMGQDVSYCFRHVMTQQVIYAGMLRLDRERFHRRVAEALEEVYGDTVELPYDLLADHFYLASVPHKAVIYRLLAGRSAEAVHADREALTHYDRAEEILDECRSRPPRCISGTRLELLLCRSGVHVRLLSIPEAIDDDRRASVLASQLGDLGSMGEALLGLGEIALHQARYLDATVLLRRAMQPFSRLQDHGAMSRTQLKMARIQALQGHFADADRSVEKAIVLEDEAQSEAGMASCRSWQGMFAHAVGRDRDAADAFRRALQLGRRAGAQDTVAMSLSGLAQVLLRRGQWDKALQSAREALQVVQSLGVPLIEADVQRVVALILTRIGAHDQAYEMAAQAVRTLANAEWRVELASAFWVAGEVCFALGRHGQARERFDNVLALGRESNTVEAIVHGQLGLSKLAEAEEDWSYEQRLCTEARARARRANLEVSVVAARLGLARAYLARQDWRHAQYEAMQAYDASVRLLCPYETLWAAATLGEALVGLTQLSRAEQYFSEASTIVAQLASTLPQPLADAFRDQPDVRRVENLTQKRRTGEAA